MKKTERLELKAQAAVAVARGLSAPRTALEVGVSAAAVRKWRGEPEFAAAVEELRAIGADRSRTPMELADALGAVLGRIRGVRPPAPVVVRYSIPAHATEAQRRRIVARAIGRGIAKGVR